MYLVVDISLSRARKSEEKITVPLCRDENEQNTKREKEREKKGGGKKGGGENEEYSREKVNKNFTRQI